MRIVIIDKFKKEYPKCSKEQFLFHFMKREIGIAFLTCNLKSVGLKIKNQSEWKCKIRGIEIYLVKSVKFIGLELQNLSD